MKKVILFLFLFACTFVFGQNPKIDSLLSLLKTDKEDTNRAIHYNKLCGQYFNIGNYDTAIVFGKQALVLSQKLYFKKGIGNSYNNIGNVYNVQGNFPDALKNYFASLEIRQQLDDKQGIAQNYNCIGIAYKSQGNYPEALKKFFACLKITELTGNKPGIAASYANIGIVYTRQGNYPEALKNQFAALKIREQIGDKQDIASSYNGIGSVFYSQHNYPDALKFFLEGLKIREELSDKGGIAAAYNNIGSVYEKQGNYPDALKNLLISLKMEEEIGDKEGIANTYINIGALAFKQNKAHEANIWLQKGLALATEIGSKEWIRDSYRYLAETDSLSGNFKAAFEHQKLYIIYCDSLNNEETKKKSLQASMQYEFDKKELTAKAEQEKLDAITKEEKQKQNIIIYAVVGVLFLVIVFSLFLFNRFRITQRQKKVIEEQKVLVDKAYETLHEKNKEVLDSIRYAKRIQTALITSEKYIGNALNRLMKKN